MLQKMTKILILRRIYRGAFSREGRLCTVLTDLREKEHPSKRALSSKFPSFPSSLGQNLLLHISKCLKNPFIHTWLQWLVLEQLSQLPVYQVEKFQLFEMWSTRSDPKVAKNGKDFDPEARLQGCLFSRRSALYSANRPSRERAPQ